MVACAHLLDGLSFATNNRNRVAVSLLHLCVEHQTGIHTLVDHGVLGSAFALVRPQFESYVRGVWIHRCASDAQVREFLSGDEPPSLGALVRAIETVPDFSEGVLARMKGGIWRNLNDFTHGGTIQVKARNSVDEVGLNWKPEHVAGLLDASASFSMLAGIELGAVTQNAQLGMELQTKHKEIYGLAA
jgi:hypothetical protein